MKHLPLHPLSFVLIVIWQSSMALVLTSVHKLGYLVAISILFLLLLNLRSFPTFMMRMLKLIPFFAFIILLQAIFRRDGIVLYGYGLLRLDSNGIRIGIMVVLRLLIILASAASLSRLNYKDFRAAFAALHLPEEIAFMVAYVLRFVHVMRQRFTRSLALLKTRGEASGSMGLFSRLRMYRILVLQVLVMALAGSHIQAIALELRGFRSSGAKTIIVKRRVGIVDIFGLWMLLMLSLFFAS